MQTATAPPPIERPATTLSSRDLTAITGCTYRQLDYATRTNRIPTVSPPEGSGVKRRYSADVIPAVWAIGVHSTLVLVVSPELLDAILAEPDAGRWTVSDADLALTLIAPLGITKAFRAARTGAAGK